MTMTLTSPVTGAAQTGFSSPTYTLTDDAAPNMNTGRQYAVTALGGTQVGATAHSLSSPFTFTFFRPARFNLPGTPNLAGILSKVPRNIWKAITRKGGTPAEGNPDSVVVITTEFSIPAGVDLYDPAEIRAAVSAHIGALTQAASGVGDSLVSGVF